ncbi:Sensor histidine kinase [hydrothermal vent metagenome]|uniref:histidine kinase n=1 Tax=hydrothermal vent metagenome TaxID=652676 RepID=A0A3B0TXV3_9ZZZZ
MKLPLPDTMAARALALLVVGLAVTHLVSNLFYATDRESALLTAGGGSVIQWVATTGAFADAVAPDEWSKVIAASNSADRFVTITDDPVVDISTGTDWRGAALQRELGRHVPAERLENYRIAFAPTRIVPQALSYWATQGGSETPKELILVSLRLNSDKWLNVATPVQAPPQFFSKRLWLSMAVMLIAVTLISVLIVRRMTEPLKHLSQAAEKLGTDVQGPAIPETGPQEVRRTAQAFNVMQNRIRRFVEDRTQMLGAIAHDLGTPITRLRLRAEFVEDTGLRGKILRDLDDMQHMVASTLAFIREDAASEPQATVDLRSLLGRVCDDIKDAGGDVELAEIERWVLIDCRPIALRRALGNLIENAVKYGEAARVSVRLEAGRVLILIDDRGPGIPRDRREGVFQPFHRLEDSRNRETGGTGLGLAVARTIVCAHGGDITLNNRPEGGLRAQLRLPRIVRTAAEPDKGKDAAVSSPVNAAGKYRFSWKTAGRDPHPVAKGRKMPIQRGLDTCLPEGRTTQWKTL